MNLQNIFLYLQSLRVDYRRHNISGVWINCSCPFARWYHAKGTDNSPSFGVSVNDEKRSYFKCLSCGQKGPLSRLAAKLGKLRGEDYTEQIHWCELTELQSITSRPMHEWDETDIDNSIVAKEFIPDPSSIYEYELAYRQPYLRERGLTWHDVAQCNLRYDVVQQRILFPIYDEQYRFRGFSGRSVMAKKYLNKGNPKVRDYFGLDKKRLFLFGSTFRKTIRHVDKNLFHRQVIVEGLIAYGRMRHHGFVNVNASLGTAITDFKIDILIERGLPVYLFFDNDKAGRDAMLGQLNNETGEIDIENSWAYRLHKHIPTWICVYDKGTDDLDPGDLTKKQCVSALKNAILYTPKLSEKLIEIW